MKQILIAGLIILLAGCKGENRLEAEREAATKGDSLVGSDITLNSFLAADAVELNLEQANKLAQLPLACINTEYPNKLNQTLGGQKDLQSPEELHPAFYGCFDWHSSVHAHWTLVRLLKQFPIYLLPAQALTTRPTHRFFHNLYCVQIGNI